MPKHTDKDTSLTTIPDQLPDTLPAHISVDSIPEAIAKLDRREQMMVIALASGMTQEDIAHLCNLDPGTISHFITSHGLRELVCYATPAHVMAFRAARWAKIEQSAVTRTAEQMDKASAMQAATIAAIASDKLERIAAQQANTQDGRGTGDILLSIKARISK